MFKDNCIAVSFPKARCARVSSIVRLQHAGGVPLEQQEVCPSTFKLPCHCILVEVALTKLSESELNLSPNV